MSKDFPNCMLKHQFLSSKRPRRDVLIAFDVIKKLLEDKVCLEANGLRRKEYYLPWSTIPKLFSTTENLETFLNK